MHTPLAGAANAAPAFGPQCGLRPQTLNVQTPFHKPWISHCDPHLTETWIHPWHGCTQGDANICKISVPVWKLKVGGWQHWQSLKQNYM